MWGAEILGFPALAIYAYFIIYSFLGWAMESLYVSAGAKKWTNRGFLSGPFCPIYGIGASLVVVALWDVRDNILLLALGGILIASVLEYLVGAILEKLFHATWWDYSQMKFNIKGRVCLERSLQWGALVVVVVHGIQPAIMRFVDWIPHTIGELLATVSLMYLMADTTITVLQVLRMNNRLSQLHDSAMEVRERMEQAFSEENKRLTLDYLDQTPIAESMRELRARFEEELAHREQRRAEDTARREASLAQIRESLAERRLVFKSKNTIERRLLRAFPRLSSRKFNEELETLKKHMQELKELRDTQRFEQKDKDDENENQTEKYED